MRILVVDDHPDMREVIREQFEAMLPGTEVLEAKNVIEALEHVRRGRFDLVLSDLEMFGGDGRDLWAGLSAEFPEQVAKLVFMSGAGSHILEDLREDTGCPAYQKPLAGLTLRAILEVVAR